ncbi:TonB-dependent siderophore receptor [Pseudothauera nasutitermitis]|uniref:TonB-dependent siderophore receptor n=1 Tax=Pseudothauera nasutitermitis TaxID=2565930 RepID=A0A4S4B4A9_9RHOO|nr:FepA family TonB-dependent siderophore receptor [Pseudothauera nasutitermitis]THF66580.1 TonB-dependent siderophore receptor [Pseudothauera nasutitermitis]
MSVSALFKLKPLVVAVGSVMLVPGVFAQQATDATLSEVHVLGTAEEMLKQMPGVSVITSEDIEKRPPANDLSEIIRRMPGVNLTGNAASGARGNNRQIDLRGMGPENTLILIDGKPVTSRNSVRMSRNGERDTRGDSNWVPAEEVERIEVIRGPAAARYGNGAAGGVVNIITKGIAKKPTGSVSFYFNQPEDNDEGSTHRVNASLSTPLGEQFGLRVYGSYNKTDADAPDINVGESIGTTAAGREGVKNKDVRALLRWLPIAGQTVDFEAGWSRQGNIYAGDTNVGSSATDPAAGTGTNPASFLGKETNTMTRSTYAITHKGDWSFGKSSVYFQYENTKNDRLGEGAAGSGEGNISTAERFVSELDNYTLNGQLDIPLTLGVNQMLTVGAEWNRQKLDDPRSIQNGVAAGINWPGVVPADQRPTDIDATIVSFFVENNIELSPDFILTPGVRLDRHSEFGNNWSPSLNASYMLTPEITLKGGVARAFKAPNLYQINPHYLYNTMGNGCPVGFTNPCYVLGNADLDPEVSVNKEIGINWMRDGWNAGITYFHNKYDNKITSGMTNLNTSGLVTGSVMRWENATDAVISGYEGNLLVPVARTLNWSTNFTYMQRNKDQYGQPLSIVPKYTVNTTLDWQATDALGLVLAGTFYGEQKPRTSALSTGSALTGDALKPRPSYNLWGISANYRMDRSWRATVGVSNLFDKKLYREGNGSSAGANTYNEPGRAFYAALTASF